MGPSTQNSTISSANSDSKREEPVVSTQPPKVVCSIFPTLIVLVSLNSHWSKWLSMVLTSWLVLKRDSKPAKTSMPISKVANKNKPQTQDDATEKKLIDQWNGSKSIFPIRVFSLINE